jgi:hypothetical protein
VLCRYDRRAVNQFEWVVPFPANNSWNISTAPVDANSGNYNYIGALAPLHPDFGSGMYQGSSIGIPYQFDSTNQYGRTVASVTVAVH